MKIKLFNLQILLYIALILALLSSLQHVAFAFATTNGANWPEAYLSAIAVDVGLLALAVGINRRKAQERRTRWLWLGVLLFSGISVYANWLAGIVHVAPLDAAASDIAFLLVGLRPILLSSVLPVLVIYLSEIVSDNHEYEQAQVQPKRKTQPKAQPQIQRASKTQAQSASKKRKVAKLANLIEAQPQATNGELAKQLKVSEATIRNYKAELAQAQNGRGE